LSAALPAFAYGAKRRTEDADDLVRRGRANLDRLAFALVASGVDFASAGDVRTIDRSPRRWLLDENRKS
jgi:hypothetical protein